VIVLLGGQDRNVDPSPLAEEAERWRQGSLRAVALPDTGADLAQTCSIEVIRSVDTVEEAVEVALEAAAPDTAVLFSPAAATPSRLGNWEARSGSFRSALAAAGGD
jgi:UDP-N-acetylmuramoylalanine-D-glutamate ligase